MTGLTPEAWLHVYECLVQIEWRRVRWYPIEWRRGPDQGIAHDPKDLLRLASVNRLAYSYFMSDERWKPFDVYGLGTGIAAHYIARALASTRAERVELVEASYPCGRSDSLYTVFNSIKHGLDRIGPAGGVSTKSRLGRCVRSRSLYSKLQDTCCSEVIDNGLFDLVTTDLFEYDYVVEILARRGHLLSRFVSEGLVSEFDYAAIAAAVSSCGEMLFYAQVVLDRALCLLAVKTCGAALRYCGRFAQDQEIALAAIASNASAIDFVPAWHKLDQKRLHEALLIGVTSPDCEAVPNVVPELVCKMAFSTVAGNLQIQKAFNYLRNDPPPGSGFPCHLVAEGSLELSHKQWARQIDTVPPRWWSVERFVFNAVSQYGNALAYAPEFRNNKRVVVAALSDCPSQLSIVDPALLGDPEVVLSVFVREYSMLPYLGPTLAGDRKFMLQLCARRPLAISRASAELWGDEEFVKEVCRQSGKTKQYLAECCRQISP